jgi:hypothetical protein
MIALKKKAFGGFGSPSAQQAAASKPVRVNFVSDMKKHGIIKDFEGVKAFKQFLENSPTSQDGRDGRDQSPEPEAATKERPHDHPRIQDRQMDYAEEGKNNGKRYHSPTISQTNNNPLILHKQNIKKAGSPGNETKPAINLDQKQVYIFPF